MRADYAKDPEKYKERSRKWTAAHPGYQREKATRRMQEWRAKNRERSNASARASMKKWRDTHPPEAKQRDRENPWKKSEECREKMRQCSRDFYLRNKAMVNERAKDWIKAHPEYRRVANNARRTAELAAGGSYTRQDILRLYKAQNGRCAACGAAFPDTGKHRYHVDHIIPLKPRNGGKPGSSNPENLQLLCRSCNSSKSNLHPDEWAKRTA